MTAQTTIGRNDFYVIRCDWERKLVYSILSRVCSDESDIDRTWETNETDNREFISFKDFHEAARLVSMLNLAFIDAIGAYESRRPHYRALLGRELLELLPCPE